MNYQYYLHPNFHGRKTHTVFCAQSRTYLYGYKNEAQARKHANDLNEIERMANSPITTGEKK